MAEMFYKCCLNSYIEKFVFVTFKETLTFTNSDQAFAPDKNLTITKNKH